MLALCFIMLGSKLVLLGLHPRVFISKGCSIGLDFIEMETK